MFIGHHDLNENILVIAEIGNNHEGSYSLAEEMIGLAARAGADAVKFQTIVPEKLISPLEKARLEQLNKYRLSYYEYEKLSKVAEQEQVLFLSTPFDLDSVDFLINLVPAFKIASGDNNFYPLLKKVAATGKPIILSTGLAGLEQIKITRDYIRRVWEEKHIQQEMVLLHCVVSYPTPIQDANLLAICDLLRLNPTVGYSDHTIGIDAAVLATALGARIIEKHFTISKTYSSFQDHALSADPEELAEMVRRVREAQLLIGKGKADYSESELKNAIGARRSIVANRDLTKGAIIKYEDLTWVRPGDGLAPGQELKLVGKILARSVACGERILLDDVY